MIEEYFQCSGINTILRRRWFLDSLQYQSNKASEKPLLMQHNHMDKLAQLCYCIGMSKNEFSKRDGFNGERMIVLPTEAFSVYAQHPMIRRLYLTDVGFFPKARHHYRKRVEGADENIFLYCSQGEGTVRIANAEYTLKPHQAICIPRLERHEYFAAPDNPWSILWVHFKGEDSANYPLRPLQVVAFNTEAATDRMMFLFGLLFRVLDANYTEGNFIYISQVLQLILSETYFREKRSTVSEQYKLVTRIIRYMADNLEHSVTLDELVGQFRLSKSYLNGLFLQHTSRTPMDFFIHLRIKHACGLLRSTSYQIAEIAKQLGYSDPYYFSRIFKKCIGISPKLYRQNDWMDASDILRGDGENGYRTSSRS